jgi:hypothetical protein
MRVIELNNKTYQLVSRTDDLSGCKECAFNRDVKSCCTDGADACLASGNPVWKEIKE